MNISKVGKMKLVSQSIPVTFTEVGGKTAAPAAKTPEKPVDKKSTPEYKDGHKDGWAERDKKAVAEVAALKQQLDAATNKLPAAISEHLVQLEKATLEEIVSTAMVVARAIIGRELATDPELTADIIRQALGQITDTRDTRVRVNPAWAEKINAGKAKLPRGMEAIADPALGVGEAIIECSRGLIDATLETRLNAVREFIETRFAADAEEKDENAEGDTP